MEDWYVETRELLPTERVFPRPERTGRAILQTVPSGPSYPLQNYQRLVVAALHGAKKRVVITTPYLIPDDELLHALETAALGDVRVQLVIPERSDQFLVGSAAKAYFDVLLDMGVEIYLFQAHILHSKTMTVDHSLAFLGTSNFDIRSFALNFELNLVLYGTDETSAIRMAQERYIAESRRLTAEEWSRRPRALRVVHGVTKLFSPFSRRGGASWRAGRDEKTGFPDVGRSYGPFLRRDDPSVLGSLLPAAEDGQGEDGEERLSSDGQPRQDLRGAFPEDGGKRQAGSFLAEGNLREKGRRGGADLRGSCERLGCPVRHPKPGSPGKPLQPAEYRR
jgi:hypothetical protein